jgi:hypothetical protein
MNEAVSRGDLQANLYRLCAGLLQQHMHIVQLVENCVVSILILSLSYNPSTTYTEPKQVIKKILNVLEWDMKLKANHGDI